MPSLKKSGQSTFKGNYRLGRTYIMIWVLWLGDWRPYFYILQFVSLIQINQPYAASFEFLLGTDKPECKRYKAIDDPTRYRAYKSGKYTNDYYLPEGWYAFITGMQMSTSCCNQHGYCNTFYQGWLMGSHPTVDDGIVSRKVCFGYYDNYRHNKCVRSINIKVRNCGPLYVYKLKPTPSSGNSRYCTEHR